MNYKNIKNSKKFKAFFNKKAAKVRLNLSVYFFKLNIFEVVI